MTTIRQEMDLLQAAGTSEGAKKGWDTRGRGRKAPDHEAVLKKHGFKPDPYRGARFRNPDEARWRRGDHRDERDNEYVFHNRKDDSWRHGYAVFGKDGGLKRHSGTGAESLDEHLTSFKKPYSEGVEERDSRDSKERQGQASGTDHASLLTEHGFDKSSEPSEGKEYWSHYGGTDREGSGTSHIIHMDRKSGDWEHESEHSGESYGSGKKSELKGFLKQLKREGLLN